MLYSISFLLLLSVKAALTQMAPVNVALNKPVTAQGTCGTPPEDFYAHSEINKPSRDRVRSICDSSNATLAHPPSNAVDEEAATAGQNFTWWQSASKSRLQSLGLNDPEAVITVDLQEVYTIEQVSIQMGDSVRPGQLALLRSINGTEFIPWEYRVSAPQDCLEFFDVSSANALVESFESVLCRTYVNAQAQPRNETINYKFDVPRPLQSWQEARFIRFEFYNMPRSFGILSDDYHHYTVRNIEALAMCNCNGHAAECTLQPSKMDSSVRTYQCDCQGNTQGTNCEECLPFYNQLAYESGESGFVCQRCFCYGHSESCRYDADIGQLNISQVSPGVFNGGGVCIDCQNNTAGINCETCQRSYYRPMGGDQSDGDACQPCGCFHPGTRTDLGIARGECVINNDSPPPFGMAPGDCYCKAKVQGTKCDECVPGTYDLQEDNSDGCSECDCSLDGSVNGSNVCDAISGQCPCKATTTNRRCGQCLDGYFNLTFLDPDGCSGCDCDVGGALSDVCDQGDGSCQCRRGVTGRQCNRAALSRYVPSLHYISAEFEDYGHLETDIYSDYKHFGYVTLVDTASISVALTVPSISSRYEILLRSITQGLTRLGLTFTPVDGSQDAPITGSVNVPLCTAWCYATARNSDASLGETFQLAPGTWEIQLDTTLQGGAKILLDQIVAVPVEFLGSTEHIFGAAGAQQFESRCDVRTNDLSVGTDDEAFCMSSSFSLVTFYLDGTLRCDCDITGSISDRCDPWGGACECKPGVGGQRCDQCLPQYYGFGLAGCTACGCFGDNKICDSITGQCDCPPNTVGGQCDRCVTFSYGLNSTTGCKMCNCDVGGSTNLQCDIEGHCPCKPGVGSRDCSSCLPEYTMFSDQGCVPCNCHPDGSIHLGCDQDNGQCDCKAHVTGLTCNQCNAGSFYLSGDNQDGCLECVCMGITSQCTSSTKRHIRYDLDPDQIPDSLPVSGWGIPESFLSGDLLGLYGTDLVLLMTHQTQATVDVTVDLMSDYGQVQFTGSLSEPLLETAVNVPMKEGYWSQLDSDEVLRSEFLQILVSVTRIIVSATSTDPGHSTSLLGVHFFEATGPASPYYDAGASQAFLVEECVCGEGYEGSSCQYCAEGFFKQDVDTHPFLGTCRRCGCNQHSQSCDTYTGECLQCQHNTAGFSCEVCMDGYYGDATVGTSSDCIQCPCNNQRTTTPTCGVIGGTVNCLECSEGHTGPLCNQCDDFYYGNPEEPAGFCMPCNCNGNSLQCDPTSGMCIDCQHRTEGFYCQRCQNFMYGNASQQDCQDCNCVPGGSTSLFCDTLTGQCPCLPNITGRQCDQCLADHYGYGSPDGCTPCSCNQLGSVDPQCFVDGTCQCSANVIGDKCDRCASGFGLPFAECQSCGCDPLGTIGGSGAICDPVTGQCPCVVGIGGRACDQCALGYIDYIEGTCTRCDLCVETLLNSADDIIIRSQNHSATFELLEQYQLRDLNLMALEPLVNESESEARMLLGQLTLIQAELENIDVESLTQRYENLQDMISSLSHDVDTDLGLSHSELLRIESIHEAASLANQVTADLEHTAEDYVAMTTSWNETSYSMTQDASSSTAEILQTSFVNFERVINQELDKSQSSVMDALHYKNGTDQQAAEVESLSQFLYWTNSLIEEIRNNISIVQHSLESSEQIVSQTDILENEAFTLLSNTEMLLDQTDERLEKLTSLAEQTAVAVSEADQAHQEAALILRGGQDGVEHPGSWSEAEALVQDMLQSLKEMKDALLPIVEEADTSVQTLELDVRSSQHILSNALTGSQLAYQAVQIYEKVVAVVSEAGYMASNASAVSQSVEGYLNNRNLSILEQEAAILKTQSSQLLNQISNLNLDIAGMMEGITTANRTVNEVIELETSIENNMERLTSTVDDLQQHSSESNIGDIITSAEHAINTTLEYSSELLENITLVNSSLQESKATIQSLESKVISGSSLIDGFPAQVSSLEDTEAEISEKLTTLHQVSNQTTQLRSNIETKMAAIRAKLARAQTRLVNSRLPARFKGSNNTLELITELPEHQTTFDEIGLSFQTEQRDGLLFFTDNPEGQGFLSLEIVASRVVFRFRISDDIVRVQSPVDVCCGEWYQVLASRYANQGHLTVTKLSTGGRSTDFARSPNIFMTYMQFQANTTLYIGGVLSNYQVDLALSRDFTGCISDVSFEREEYDLWQPSDIRGSISCCEGPQATVPPPPATIEGFSLDGFGHLQLPSSYLDIFNESSFSVEFRTSVRDAVILSVARAELISYIGIFLSGGQVVFDMNTAGNTGYKITSEERYDDAQWYKVQISYNTSSYSMELSYDNGTIREDFQRRTLYSLSFPNLRHAAEFYIGSEKNAGSEILVRAPTDLGFAGGMRNVYVSNGGPLQPITINENTVLSFDGVQFNSCLAEVTQGFGFRGGFAYAELRLPEQLSATMSLQFYFKTKAPHGILAYAFTATKLFYVTLYHGNIFIQYNVGQGLSNPLQTRGQWLNTGQWQLVTIEFTALSVSLKVNNQPTIYSSRQLGTDGIGIDGSLYLGGVPVTFPFLVGGQFPVRESLSGDMKDFSINGLSPNLNDPSIVTRHEGLVLDGIPPAVVMLPKLPYPTLPPEERTVPPQSCQGPVDVILYPGVYRLGVSTGGYLAFDLVQEQAAYFLISFVATIQFRAHSSEGILYYGASDIESPSEWFALVLEDGRISFNMMTSSGRTTGLDVTTKDRYDTGQWYEVLVLRINDFVALLVDETDEYIANGESTAGVLSQLHVNTRLYVGGLRQDVSNDYVDNLMNGKFFDGCVRMVEVSGNFARDLVFPLSSPSESKNVELCEQNDVTLDTYFTGDGYLLLDDEFLVPSSFEVQVSFTTSQQEALLFAIFQDKSSFFILELMDGGMRAVVNRGSTQPTVIRASGVGQYELCNGREHTASILLTETFIEITVDGGTTQRTAISETGGTIRGAMYVGGISENQAEDLTTGISTISFQGCVSSLSLNKEDQNLDEFVESSGVRKGCPLQIP